MVVTWLEASLNINMRNWSTDNKRAIIVQGTVINHRTPDYDAEQHIRVNQVVAASLSPLRSRGL